MDYLHRGVDSLDLSYPVLLPESTEKLLAEAKAMCGSKKGDKSSLFLNGQGFWVRKTGASGGYAYSVWTGEDGENIFLKKANTKDPWGVRVSHMARPLSNHGMAKAVAASENRLRKMGLDIKPGSAVVGRVDVCVDLLTEWIDISNQSYISRMKHREWTDGSAEQNGRDGVINSIRFGDIGRCQVAVYDKLLEISHSNKTYMKLLWNERRTQLGYHPIAFDQIGSKRVLRTECRWARDHLRKSYGVRTIDHLVEKLPIMVADTLDDVRMIVPTRDQNRSRWPTHPFWQRVRDELLEELINLEPLGLEDEMAEMSLAERLNRMMKQAFGYAVNIAALRGATEESFERALSDQFRAFREQARRPESALAARLADIRARYAIPESGESGRLKDVAFR